MKKQWCLSIGCSVVAVCANIASAQQFTRQMLADDEIRAILADRIDRRHAAVGIVVGIVQPQERRIVAWGRASLERPIALDADTIFEIGSITKIFSAIAVTDAAVHHQISLRDRVQTFLPISLPEFSGRGITFEHLMTHTSGLPRDPSNGRRRGSDLYGEYSVEQMYQFLNGLQLSRAPGDEYEYSNLGGALLGDVLSRMTGLDYEESIRRRVADPLRMPSTRTRLTPELQARLAQGYDSARAPLPSAFVPPLAGVGGLRSTASDLLTLLAAQLGFVQSPLHEAMDLMTKPRRPTGIANLQIALVWHIDTTSGEDIFWHNGASAGYRAFVGFRPRGNVGVVVLSNTSTWASAEEIGLFLLHPDVTRLFNGAVVSKLETVH